MLESIVTKSKAVLFILTIIIVLGINSLYQIAKESTPDVQIPKAVVSMYYEGISPEDGVRLLIKPLENELGTIDGLKKMKSYAKDSNAYIILDFRAGYDIDECIEKVRDKVTDNRWRLPGDMEQDPFVQEINLSKFPVLNVLLSGDIPEREMITIARDLSDKMEMVNGVLEVGIIGDRDDIIEIEIDPVMLEGYSLSIFELNDLISQNNQLIAAGSVETKGAKYTVKVLSLLEDLEEVERLPIKTHGNATIKVGDIAKVRKIYKDRTSYARVDGESAIALEVVKKIGANIIDTVDEVRSIVKEEQLSLPSELNIKYSNDNSEEIIEMLLNLKNNIIFSVLLVLIVVIAFIGVSCGFLVAISIPISFLMGILIIYLMGYTLNMVVLFALILSIGLLVDTGIVIVEYAELKMREGHNAKDSFLLSVKDMSSAIISSTITTLIVFMPLLFWPGVAGQFMKFLPLTLIFVLSSSLVTALIFLPCLGITFSRFLFKHSHIGKSESVTVEALPYYKFLRHLTPFSKKFANTQKLFLKKPFLVVGSIITIMVFVFALYGKLGNGTEFFPDIEPEQAVVNIKSGGNLSLEVKDKIVRAVENRILDLNDDVEVFYAKSISAPSLSSAEDLIGVVSLQYHDWEVRRKSAEILQDIQDRSKDLFGVQIETELNKSGPSSAKPIEIEIRSKYDKLLNNAVDELMSYMKNSDDFVNPTDDRSFSSIEWEVIIDREEAAKSDVSMGALGAFIRLVTNGLTITTYRPEDVDDEVDIVVRFPKEKRNMDELNRLKIDTKYGKVPISNFIKQIAKPKVGTIKRVNSMRTITVQSDLKEGVVTSKKLNDITKWIEDNKIDSRVEIKFAGDKEEQDETMQFLMKAFMIAITFMALVLLIQFNAFFQVIIIMSAILLSITGVLISLMITGRPLSVVMCGIGIISLCGVVVNDNIILIETYKKFKAMNMGLREAVIKAVTQRLGPILLTSITTILGLVPMIVGMNIDFATGMITFGSPSSQWWTQLSTTIAGGMAFATILTLFFTPACLLIGDNVVRRMRLKKERVKESGAVV